MVLHALDQTMEVAAAEAQMVEAAEQYSTHSMKTHDSEPSQLAIHSQHNGPLHATPPLLRLPWRLRHLPIESLPQSTSPSTPHLLPCPSIDLVHPQAPFPSPQIVQLRPIASSKQPVHRRTLAFPSMVTHPQDRSQSDMLTFDQKQV